MPKQKGRVLKQLVIVDNLNDETSDTNFSPLSKEITTRLSKEEKKENGIFFTPVSIISKIMYVIKLNKIIVQTILEPSCGSCEIIHTINKYFNNIDIHGIEKNDTIYESIRNIEFCHRNNNTITLERHDFLQTDTNRKYDLIIGNPPFFVLKKDDVDKKFDN